VLIDHLSENCRGWSKKRLLEYMKATLEGVSEPSESDTKSLEIFRDYNI
jgi:hypothetical protein